MKSTKECNCNLSHELQGNEEPTTVKMVIQVLAYASSKWIVDVDPLKVQPAWHICVHENIWLRKVTTGRSMATRDPLLS